MDYCTPLSRQKMVKGRNQVAVEAEGKEEEGKIGGAACRRVTSHGMRKTSVPWQWY